MCSQETRERRTQNLLNSTSRIVCLSHLLSFIPNVSLNFRRNNHIEVCCAPNSTSYASDRQILWKFLYSWNYYDLPTFRTQLFFTRFLGKLFLQNLDIQWYLRQKLWLNLLQLSNVLHLVLLETLPQWSANVANIALCIYLYRLVFFTSQLNLLIWPHILKFFFH